MTATELAIQHYEDIAQQFARFGPDVAADLTQETFARLTSTLDGSDRGSLHYLRKVAWGVGNDYLRRVYREEAADAGPVDGLPYGTPWQAEISATFDAALRDLPDEERDAFILMELRGTTADEAADLLGVSRRTLYRRLSDATETLREELA